MSQPQRLPLTKTGAAQLRADLDELKSVRRPEIIKAIADAREHGDLKENAEYHAAREQQSFVEGRINEIESSLSLAQIIDVATLNAGDRIVFGATVDLACEDSDEEVTYQIVGELEADIGRQLISISSPFARALIGKRVGDSVSFDAPSGTRGYEVLAVRYTG